MPARGCFRRWGAYATGSPERETHLVCSTTSWLARAAAAGFMIGDWMAWLVPSASRTGSGMPSLSGKCSLNWGGADGDTSQARDPGGIDARRETRGEQLAEGRPASRE